VNTVLLHLKLGLFDVQLTPWKLVGYLGLALFTGRWFVQLYASRAAGSPVLPRAFWYMSIAGSLLLLAYFIFGKNDSVGILANLFPLGTALYNLSLELRPPGMSLGAGMRSVRKAAGSFAREVARVWRENMPRLLALLACGLLIAAVAVPFDAQLATGMAQATTPAEIAWARQLSWWGELQRGPLIAALIVAGWLAMRGEHRLAARGLVASLSAGPVAGILVDVLKVILARPRPSSGLPDGFQWLELDWAFHSFPSGHAAHCFGIIGAWLVLKPRTATWLALGGCIVCWARLCLGRHYLSDCIVGGAIGLTTGVSFGLAALRVRMSQRLPALTTAPPPLGEASA
jgi:lipid-A-disaccharide synthase-like uncharacterized protein/membrane-associated phospholipid phosphatase